MKNWCRSIVVLSLYLFTIPSFAENFIRKIHTVDLPFAPGAYNASLIAYEEGYLLAYRFDIYKAPVFYNLHAFFQYVRLVKLDKEFKPIGTGSLYVELGNRSYDPRLVQVGSSTYLTFTSPKPEDPNSNCSSRINLTKVHDHGTYFTFDHPVPLTVEFQYLWEKNWSPFNYQGTLCLSYSVNPHKVIVPYENGSCDLICETTQPIQWDFGIIRGGTPALLVDEEYLAFFHSSLWSPSANRFIYSMGAYTFSAHPPFPLKRISSRPFAHPDFYSTPMNDLTYAQVVFPAGIAVKDNTIFVSYGENDGAIKVMEIDRALLYQSLERISSE
jgi:predicted GH43/DUF377 family glycosyl hydrolase